MKLTYREQIIQTLNNLIETREIIFEQIVNLAMSNEYSGLHNTFEIGETYNFTLNHFKKMEDINVRKMVTLCKNSEKTIFAIMNLNGIKENEINLNEKN